MRFIVSSELSVQRLKQQGFDVSLLGICAAPCAKKRGQGAFTKYD